VGAGERRAGGPGPPQVAAQRFRPQGQDDLAPAGAVTRIRANLAALKALRALQREARPATTAEQAELARWSGWGAVPEVFDPARQDLAWARAELATLLAPAELAAAARNTLNAHYTDADLVQAIWAGVQQLGFAGGRVLEPGCGSGNFIAFAPGSARVTGVELEPVTAQIAAALYPDAEIRNESFADTRCPEGSFDLAIGNVPFGDIRLTDRRHNRAGHSIHNHYADGRIMRNGADGPLVAGAVGLGWVCIIVRGFRGTRGAGRGAGNGRAGLLEVLCAGGLSLSGRGRRGGRPGWSRRVRALAKVR